ncbi:hypothetical protein M433DRAFT_156657 [Acidomyces richmondensis BFW]|nr:MAG: hypothetical protein FE78DRAFT_90048 [Acidomyces sp. 'richmondensis']KYG43501.1 hypothetical protein M433DRAFT_156657 [Acidomyces richmondensis BFW]
MAQTLTSSTHTEVLHDAVLDHYGRRLATCSSDKTLKIYSIDPPSTTSTTNSAAANPPTHHLTATLTGHDSAVWCVAWSHPSFGTILASCGYDGRILLFREQPSTTQSQQQSQQSAPGGRWERIYEFTHHTASVNMVAWSPPEVGCHLAAASSDGNVSVITFENNTFSHVIFPAHGLGVNSVSWAPALLPGQLTSAVALGGKQTNSMPEPQRRFATGGSDNLVKLWSWNPATGTYDHTLTLQGHTDWVRDVSISPTPLSKMYVASASQDHTVRIWTLGPGKDMRDAAAWGCEVLEFGVVVWRVSWSLAGNVLAVSGEDNRVSLWKERGGGRGGWECVKTLEE